MIVNQLLYRMVILFLLSGLFFVSKFVELTGLVKSEISKSFRRPFIFIFLTGILLSSAQLLYSDKTGFKYFKNYTYRDYGRNPENFMVAQDSRRIIYFANTTSVLEFDGASWQSTPVPGFFVFSLAVDENNTIYFGGRNDIGFLNPDSKGELQCMSLLNQLKNNQKVFPHVWPIYCVKDNIYFNSPKFLFQWDKKKEKMKVWESDHTFEISFKCGAKFFVFDKKVGLMQLVDNSLKPISGGKALVGKNISMMAPYDFDAKRILIGTRSNGFYIYEGDKAFPFPTGADDYVRENKLSFGIRLSASPDRFALATQRGGLVVIDSNGDLRYIFNKTSGLQDNQVNFIFEDFQGNLWLALSRGISKIEYSSPFAIYDERVDLPGLIMSIIKHRGVLYVGTNKGLFFLSSFSFGRFQPVSGISAMCWSILSIGDSLLAATNEGLFQVQNKSIRKIIERPSLALHRSKRDNNRIWVGTAEGLVSLYQKVKNGRLVVENKFENITGIIRTIAEDKKGDLWMGTLMEGIIKVDFPANTNHPVVTRYYTSHGLPMGEVRVFKAAGHVTLATDKGIFRLDEVKNVCIPDRTFGERFVGDGYPVHRIVEDKKKNIWINSNWQTIQAIPNPDGPYVFNSTPFRRIPKTPVNAIYPDGDNIWFGCIDSLVRFNTKVKKNYNSDFPVVIRKVQSINRKFPIFGGHKTNTGKNSQPSFLTLKYKHRNLHIEFAAPFFEDESRTTYRYFLEGHDKGWSIWVSETHVDYPDLDPGFYTFRVQAKNLYGHPSSEDVFQFKILPPWYRTWWAFLCYVLGFFLIIYLAVKWRSRKLEQEKKHLEQIIKERTKEIEGKNQQLEKQTFQLKEQSGQLMEMDKVKSRFFANISHEFRTPLTLIMGPLEQILTDSSDKQLKQNAGLMLRNSKRLLKLVNQLLELASLDSGKMTLQTSLQNIVPFLKSMMASFESLAVQQKLELTFQAEEEDIMLYFDTEKLEKITLNLLSNAVKFTPPGGKITVSVKKNLTKETNFPCGSLEISICDTGIGILESQLEQIFERFYQVNGSYEHKQKGSGIGLALTKELVGLHHGEIHVQCSTGNEGKTCGTEFVVRLPMGKDHLKPGKIIDPNMQEIKITPLSLHKKRESYEIRALDIDLIEIEDDRLEKVESDGFDAGAEDAGGIEIESGTQGKNIILVVEDSNDMRAYIKSSLEPLYQVVEASNGEKGIQKAKEIIPDLIISDIMMPEVNGYELCNVLKKNINTSHIPIILLTAKASEESVIQGLKIGADDYITKPFNAKILVVRIKNMIDLRSQLQLERKRQMTLQPTGISVSSIDETFYKELRNIIEKDLTNPEFNVDQLCRKLYMARTSLYRKILALTGETPSQFIRSLRLKQAAQLLKADFGNVTEVAFAVGFSNTAYFTKCFKEKFHQLPSTFPASEIREPVSH